MTQQLTGATPGFLLSQPRVGTAAVCSRPLRHWPVSRCRILPLRSTLVAHSNRSNAKADIADTAVLQREVTVSATEDLTATESPDVLTAAAAAPRPGREQQLQQYSNEAEAEAVASTSGREHSSTAERLAAKAQRAPDVGKAFVSAVIQTVNQPPDDLNKQLHAHVQPLPHKNFGNLRGGQYPFMYDPVYGLPIVHDVAKYGEVLRDIRQGLVQEVLWFFEPNVGDTFYTDGRCLIRYKDGRVRQSVVPLDDFRVPYAMEAHGVKATKLPLEPRHIPEYSIVDDTAPAGAKHHPVDGPNQRQLSYTELDVRNMRRGPRLGPSFTEQVLAADPEDKDMVLEELQEDYDRVIGNLERADTEEWDWYTGKVARPKEYREVKEVQQEVKKGWADKIIVSQDMQVLIYKWVPIIGPVLGSAFVIGLYIAARLLKGDLTDRMKLMDEGEEKRKRTALKEARIAFLEEEVPALVARNTELATIKKKAADVNKKLGDKFEISETELMSTIEACNALLTEGQDLDTGEAATQAAERILAQEDADASRAAAEGAEGGGGEAQGADALMEMGKLNTARIRKAVDPKILDVKKRVRAARRSLKRESKVVLSDEIIFFDDVAGNEQAKVELMEVVDFFRKPEKFRASGARPPKGVLLVGPPGNGKTLMARAVAGESGVAFISSSASEFIEMYMGLGAARVRDLFNTARKLSPCIIFIDELDAVGRARRSGSQGGNDERDNTVNQLLTELDGFSAETQGIVVMGATNRKDVLDPALTRPGRFDRSIEVCRPDFQGRLEGIKVHLREKPIAADIDYSELAMLTGGMSGAQLAGVCNTACFLASRAGRTEVTQADLVAAVEQTKYGKTYEASKFVSPGRKRRFAVIEAGFCVAIALLPAIEEIDYVTILPSIKSPVGRTVLKPNVGRYTTGVWTRQYLEQQLVMILAGRAAEELVFGREEMSSLHQHKIMQARQIVHKMLNAGFSSHPDFEHIRSLGSTYVDPSMEPNRYTSYITQTDSHQTRSEWVDIDIEMENKLNQAYEEVKALLSRNRAALDALTQALLAQEQLKGDDVYKVLADTLNKEDLENRLQALEGVEFM